MKVAFRTQGGHAEGLGDIHNALALAGALVAAGDEIFFVLSGDGVACELVNRHGYQFTRSDDCAAALNVFAPDIIVVIKLNSSSAELEQLLNDAGGSRPLLVTIDDSGSGATSAGLRINALYAPHQACSRRLDRNVFGTEFVALRREFRHLHDIDKPIVDTPVDLLVLQGGADTYGFLPKIVRCLSGTSFHCRVVTGQAFRHQQELTEAVRDAQIELEVLNNSDRMSELMFQADIAITAGGISMFELACVGTPAIVVAAERFEVESAARFAAAGAVVNLGFGGDLACSLLMTAMTGFQPRTVREKMSLCGKRLVDGKGADRIIGLLKEHHTLKSGE